MVKSYLIMNIEDNCATALSHMEKGKRIQISDKPFNINDDIQIGHKFALKDISKGDYIKKYGYTIGIATESIQKGDWIHTHNIKSKYLEEVDDD